MPGLAKCLTTHNFPGVMREGSALTLSPISFKFRDNFSTPSCPFRAACSVQDVFLEYGGLGICTPQVCIYHHGPRCPLPSYYDKNFVGEGSGLREGARRERRIVLYC